MKGSPIYHSWRLQLYAIPERIHQLTELERAQLIVIEESLYSLLNRRIEAGGGEIRDHTLVIGQDVIPLIVLTGERRELEQHELLKYQSLSTLLHSMQQRYEYYRSEHEKDFRSIGAQTKIIGVCSTLEQTGKTLLALHMAALLANKGYRVFYFNLEQWNTSDYYLQGSPNDEGPSYSDLLYLVKSKQNVKKWLAERVTARAKYGFYTLHPFQHEADRIELVSQQAETMVSAVAESELYDYVIIDLPAGINHWSIPILQRCAAHYMVVLPQRAWQNKHRLALARAAQEAAVVQQLQLERWSVLNELCGNTNITLSQEYKASHSLPYVEAWQQGDAVLMSSASYRAAVEHCLTPLLKKAVRSGGLNVG